MANGFPVQDTKQLPSKDGQWGGQSNQMAAFRCYSTSPNHDIYLEAQIDPPSSSTQAPVNKTLIALPGKNLFLAILILLSDQYFARFG